jgi:hypothetical protein
MPTSVHGLTQQRRAYGPHHRGLTLGSAVNQGSGPRMGVKSLFSGLRTVGNRPSRELFSGSEEHRNRIVRKPCRRRPSLCGSASSLFERD